jgi:hypothetical protein
MRMPIVLLRKCIGLFWGVDHGCQDREVEASRAMQPQAWPTNRSLGATRTDDSPRAFHHGSSLNERKPPGSHITDISR